MNICFCFTKIRNSFMNVTYRYIHQCSPGGNTHTYILYAEGAESHHSVEPNENDEGFGDEFRPFKVGSTSSHWMTTPV